MHGILVSVFLRLRHMPKVLNQSWCFAFFVSSYSAVYMSPGVSLLTCKHLLLLIISSCYLLEELKKQRKKFFHYLLAACVGRVC